ncbi:MAG TPA: hypothetical protein VKZ87_00660 [Ferrovibrio sp.]|uniref:hypothetical protein n=1 Tax=Ferrovibrio sp. TaxID=1917215 RepID=UPI002B4AF910|nr:hypothetical protein [Ferrovibrio sp.]HLT75867.1 hypothetical protein [Ferrovibrio sp.]
MLRRTLEFFFPPAVATRAELEAFVRGEASYLAQKCVIGYCRVKTMQDYEKLLTEAAFRDGLEACRWEAYAGTLADTLILVEGLLRPAGEPARQQVADSLAAFYAPLLGDVPAHRTDWNDAIAAFDERFSRTRQEPPAHPRNVTDGTAKVIYRLAPIHPRLKGEDLEVVRGDLRLHAVAMHASMLKRFRREALLRELTA